MIRFLIIIALIYFASRYVKSIFNTNESQESTIKDTPAEKIDDVMIKDPVCNVYFPKKDGVHIKVKGRDLYFCSPDCRDKYMSSTGK